VSQVVVAGMPKNSLVLEIRVGNSLGPGEESGSRVARMLTSQNRDMGTQFRGGAQMWATA